MFTIIRKFTLTRGAREEIVRRVQDSFVPLLREQPGFRAYYLLNGGPDVLISVRVFDNADHALASNEIAASWMIAYDSEDAIEEAEVRLFVRARLVESMVLKSGEAVSCCTRPWIQLRHQGLRPQAMG